MYSAKVIPPCVRIVAFQGVFFVLATKSIPVPVNLSHSWRCGRRVHAFTTDESEGQKEDALEEGTGKKGKGRQRAPLGGGGSRSPTPLGERDGSKSQGRHTRSGRGGEQGDNNPQEEGRVSLRDSELRRGGNAGEMGKQTELELPPRHWMCTVCKKVGLLSGVHLRTEWLYGKFGPS